MSDRSSEILAGLKGAPENSGAKKSAPVRAWAVRCRHWPEHEAIVNEKTRGRAISKQFRNALDAWPDLKWTDFSARVAGPAHTSKNFARCAEYRGVPGLKCGDRVKVGEATGVVVGHDESANFRVLFDEGSKKYSGIELSVHVAGLEVCHG